VEDGFCVLEADTAIKVFRTTGEQPNKRHGITKKDPPQRALRFLPKTCSKSGKGIVRKKDPSQRALRFLPKTCSKSGKGIGRNERISQRALGFSPKPCLKSEDSRDKAVIGRQRVRGFLSPYV
jgi:hypothetical protein